MFVFFFKQKTAYEMRISDWSSDVCSSDLRFAAVDRLGRDGGYRHRLGEGDGEHLVLCGVDLAAARSPGTRSLDAEAVAFGEEQRRLSTIHGRGQDESVPGALATIDLRSGAVGRGRNRRARLDVVRSEEHTSELQSLMRISYAVFCLKTTKHTKTNIQTYTSY